jgi:hypothetical protein
MAHQEFTDAEAIDILALHEEGFSNIVIAERLGFERHRVGYFLRSKGLRSTRRRQAIIMVDDVNACCTKCEKIVPRSDLPWGRVTAFSYQLSYCRRCLTDATIKNISSSVPQYLRHRERALKARAKRAGITYDLPGGYLYDLYALQQGLCFYTDEQMKIYFGTEKSGSRRDSLSVDKIIPELGYVPYNVVLCIARANAVKYNCTLQEIKEWLPGWYIRLLPKIEALEIEGTPYTVVPGWDGPT